MAVAVLSTIDSDDVAVAVQTFGEIQPDVTLQWAKLKYCLSCVLAWFTSLTQLLRLCSCS